MEGDDYDIDGPSPATSAEVDVSGSAEESGVQSYIDFEQLLHEIIGHAEDDGEQVAGDCDGAADPDFIDQEVEGDEEIPLDNFGAPIEGKEKAVDFSLDDGSNDLIAGSAAPAGGFYQFVSGDADDNQRHSIAPDNLLNLEYQDEEDPDSNHIADGDQGAAANTLNRSFNDDIQMHNDAALFAE